MIVKAILSAKGTGVITIEPTATLDAAVKTLAKHRIGALLVLGPDRRAIGILSERDIVRALAEHGAGVLTQPLGQIMTRKVVTCSQSDTCEMLMQRMTTGKFRHLPVVEQENRDLLIRLLAHIHRPMNTGARFLPLDLPRRDLNVVALASVTILNGEEIASQDHCHSLKWIAVPRHTLSAHSITSVTMKSCGFPAGKPA